MDDTNTSVFIYVASIIALLIGFIIGYLTNNYTIVGIIINFIFFELATSFVKRYVIQLCMSTCPVKNAEMVEYTSRVYTYSCLVYMLLGKFVNFIYLKLFS